MTCACGGTHDAVGVESGAVHRASGNMLEE